MDWARIIVPLMGREDDDAVLAAAAEIASAVKARVCGVYVPVDAADLAPWLADGMVGAVEVTALEAVRAAAREGEREAMRRLTACTAKAKDFIALDSPVWSGLALESRLSDLVVFGSQTAKGKTRLAQAFQDVLGGEQRPILVARAGPLPAKTVVVAWNGGKEATRAARTALPLLRLAGRVIVASVATEPRREDADPARLADFLVAHGVKAEPRRLKRNDPAPAILELARENEADLVVAGAFGHARLREFIFGGVTRNLLHADGPSLFLSH